MKKKAISIVCIVLAFLMMVTLVVSVVGSLGALAADEQDQIDALEQQKVELQSQQASIQTNINDLMAQQADVIEQKAAMDEKNELARQEIELINEQIDVYTDLIEQKARELEKAEAAEQAQYDLYCKRVRAMEEEGSYTYLDILFQCRSLSDVLSAIDMIGEIMDADKRLFEEYKTARENTEQVKAEYEGTLQQLGEKQETLEAEIAAAVEVINQLENDIEAAKAEYAKAAAAEAAAQASINAIIAQMQAEEEAARQEAAENNQQYTGTGSTATGTYIWPCPSSTYVTSAFGMREHPLFGDERPHSGIDIAGSAGSEVLAADSGTVAVATYSSSYGNYVTIYHSNGDYTLYAHMSSLAVTAGQNVTQGDVIGYVGSTGWATGPHLHFEIRVNGSTVDPLSYFSNYTLAPDA